MEKIATRNPKSVIYKIFLAVMLVGMHGEYQFSSFNFLGTNMKYSSIEFVIGVSILFLCGYIVYEKIALKEIFREKTLCLILFLFCMSLILSTIFARYKVEAIKYDIRIIAIIVLFYLLLQFLYKEKLKDFSLIVFNVVGIAVCLVCILKYFNMGWANHVFGSWGEGSRTIYSASVFVHNNPFGNYLVLLIVITLGQLKETRGRIYQILLGAVLGLYAFALVLSLSRSAWVAFTVTGGLCLWLKRKDKRVIIWSAILLLLFIVILAGIPAAKQRVVTTVSRLNNAQINDILSQRLDLWRTAVIIFKKYPFFGIGLNNFKDTFPEYTTPDMAKWPFHIHAANNQYFNVLAEQGIFGFIVFVGFVGYLIALGIKNIRQGGNEFFALAIIAYLVGALFDYMWVDYSFMFIFWFVVILNLIERRKLCQIEGAARTVKGQ